jgi:UPF0755 protein
LILIIITITWFGYLQLFGAPVKSAKTEIFVVGPSDSPTQTIFDLKKRGFIKSDFVFSIAVFLRRAKLAPGGYQISKSMNVWQLAEVFKNGPTLKWVVIPEGFRKEQIAEILAREFDWDEETKNNWVKKYTALKPEEIEGVYFPDTYLIPKDEPPEKVAARLRAKFNEVFAPYLAEAAKQNIKWTTLLKLASLVEKEAGKNDHALVAGILWNRLLQNIPLQVDATLQYIKGAPGNWWPKILPEDKKINSPYNTYLRKGLPPTPIANPGLRSIKAVLFPEKTECLYYLHDAKGEIHCSKNYAEHLKNIEIYIKK